MFSDPQFNPLKKLVYSKLNIQETERIDISAILDTYIHKYHGHSLLRDDVFLMLAISIIIKKRMKKLKQQILEAKESIFNDNNNKIQNQNLVTPIAKKRKVQKQRREQIVVDNQLIKLPNYFSQTQNSQLAKEESILLPGSQQTSFHSQQQIMQIEEEGIAPEQIFVPDYRDLLRNQGLMQQIHQQDENIFQTEIKQANIENGVVYNLYQQMLEQLHISIDAESVCNEECETRQNTRKKIKVQMDQGIRKQKIQNYKSQFYELEDEESHLLQKLESYLINEYKIQHQDQLTNQDEMLQQIFSCLNDSSYQNQLLSMVSIMNPEEIYLNQSCESNNKSNVSVKSVLRSRNLSEDSIKSLKRIHFVEEQHLEEIQEELSNHYNTSMSLFQEKSSYDKAKSLDQQVFNINDCFYYKMLQQQFYYDVFKIVQQMSANQIITTNEKENLKNIIINHDSKFVQTLDTIYKSEENEKFEKIVAEIKSYIKSMRQRKPKYLKNKQMRVITDETDKNIYDDIIAEVSSDSDSMS
ncbi:unnamed protein product [Paramecium pentaurelia]|uniref:Uncharacterized protein n=1 Tax=Paramecium pentaurelia TaxID=43138 RepID=A0A8S1SET4_9CILI|nr:unnamed protein product [Paramecium pentaurelia]